MSERSFTIAPLTDVPASAATRLRKLTSGKSESMASIPTSKPMDDEDPGPDPGQTDAKKRKKDATRKKNAEHARTKVELAQAVHVVRELIQTMQHTAGSHQQHTQTGTQTNQLNAQAIRRDSLASLASEPSAGNLDGDMSGSQVISEADAHADLLESMLTLSKLTKRLTQQKKELEASSVTQQHQIDALEASNRELFEQLEHMAARLRDEKAATSHAVKELQIRYEHQLATAAREVEVIKAQMATLRATNRNLNDDLEANETRLMEVPRLEESYLRTARGLVRQKELLVNEKEVKIRSMQTQVEQAEFFRQRAAALSEDNLRKDNQTSELKRQLQIIAHNYRQLIKENAKTQSQLDVLEKKVAHDKYIASTRGSSPPRQGGHSRASSPSPPSSPIETDDVMQALLAAAAAGESAHAHAFGHSVSHAAGSSAKNSALPTIRPATSHATAPLSSSSAAQAHGKTPQHAHNTHISHTQHSHSLSHTHQQHQQHSDSDDFNAKEVQRLRKVIDELTATNKRLHFKLANARAYPLLCTQESIAIGGNSSSINGGNGGNTNGNTSGIDDDRHVGKVYVSELDELFDPADVEPDEDGARAAASEKERIERALSIQRAFVTRIDEIRGRRPQSAHFLASEKVRSKMSLGGKTTTR